ncbi:hypothetical protein KL918_002587 [Ogataea parapolymorpha]|uniref:Sporulation protein RMD1 n=1 Tax=Ogataea parapolymorpha (strain ATCC 26012 / BCRC 20466 / JCM 22074 / NRRL Y-7560 / DL-1) TaxID=871575 RepID=W1QFU8_OGAPD|nr:Sporulation protein RMD1 [Ogataea parapolymorpha DL-1]ESX00942.1 Sporulation protein RMD1 [Ogataea parapolymorpha DL-1]KAG7867148.1 hypothetical protein KL918_002587 [Ogataea parapolymorpha]KAG7870848.1 hypothetical protein KL916_004579 [Ogataea parapolymorpha]
MSATERTALLSDNPYGSVSLETAHRPASTGPEAAKPKNVAKELGPNIVPQRASRTSQKLKLLPDQLDYTSIDSSVDKSYSLQKITDRPARKDAERLGKKHRSLLPRVTAYCTAGSYKMRDLIRWLKDRKRIHGTMPKLFDECIYTPFAYKDWRSNSNGSSKRPDFSDKSSLTTETIRLDDEGGEIDVGKRSTDVFIFEYGVVVLWGFSKREEEAFLVDLAKFENEKLSDEDVQAEEFNYYITHSYQPRIYNDFITLRDDSNYMLKLSISYAISQSVKISLFEELVDNTIEDTQDIPQQIAQTGKVEMSREEIMKSIGELFILRININLHGSVLDSPELMWSEPQLEPIYQATRGYMEINQRVALLNQRLEVISDLLQMLKEQLGHSNDEYLEFIVIMLIGAEVIVSIINIIVDIVGQR